MSVGPEALRRFGPLLFLACPRGQAAVRARGAGLLCVPVGPGCCACPRGQAAVRARGARLLCVPHGCSGLLRVPHGCSWLLCAPVGGGPPARRPRHEPSARRVASKPGQAPPPPTGTAARPTNSSGTLHTSGVCPFCAYPIQAPPPPTSTTARRTNSSGTLHTSGAVVADVARRIVSKPGQTPPPPTGTAARPTNSSGTIHTSVVCRYCAYPIQAPPPPTSTTARPTNSSRAHHTSVVCRYCAYPIQAPPPPTSAAAIPSRFSVLSTPVTVGFYRIRSWLPACRGSNDATFPFGGAEATT